MTDVATSRLAELKFKNSARPSIVKAAKASDSTAFKKSLTKALAKVGRKFDKELPETSFAALWSEAIAVSDADRELVALLPPPQAKLKKKALLPVAEHVAPLFSDQALTPSPFVAIVAAELLLRHIEHCSAEQVATIYCGLNRLKVQDWAGDPVPPTPAITDCLMQSVAQGEVPFLLSLLLDDVQTSKARRGNAIRKIASAIEDVTDTDGSLQAVVGRHAIDWLAPIVRITSWSRVFKTDWAVQKTVRRWERTLHFVAALMTPDGLLTTADAPQQEFSFDTQQPATILQHGLRLAGVSASSKVRSLAIQLTEKRGGSRSKKFAKSKLKKASVKADRCNEQSDWAEFALLRNGLRVDADVMAMDWDEAVPNVRLAALGTKLLNGEWTSRIRVNGVPHETAGSWVCTCWFEDKEVAFAELESGSADGVRHVRHIMLSLDQHVAVITDSVTGPDDEADIEFTSTLPLSPGTTAETDSITREVKLNRHDVGVRAIPAWLEDDRIIQALGTCDVQDGKLVMTARNKGGVTLPLVLDWHPERAHRDPDWSRLTVTEEQQVLKPRDAAAYRVRVGNYQLLLYRSLRCGETLRAVLGYHTAHETVYGRVKKNGDIAPLVLVESETE